MIDLTLIEGFEWDEGNARKNEKNGVTASEAEQVFFNQPLLMLEDAKHSQAEPRFYALGMTHTARKLHITFTVRGTRIRVISARNEPVRIFVCEAYSAVRERNEICPSSKPNPRS